MLRPLSVLLLTGLALVSGRVAAEPARIVEGFHDALVQTLRAEADFDARLDAMREAVREAFNLPTVARVSIGPGWRQLEASQRRALVAALHELISTTYAERFTRYNSHVFATLATDTPQQGRAVVRTELRRVDGDPVSLVYHLDDGGIFNVVADGVSDLSLRRAQYGAVFRRDGFEALLDEIRRQIDELRE